MSTTTCIYCNREFGVISKLKRHQQAITCNINKADDNTNDSENSKNDNTINISCESCGKSYKHKSSLHRHLKICEKHVENSILVKKNVITQMMQMIVNLSQQVANLNPNSLEKTQNSTSIVTTATANTTTNSNNSTIVQRDMIQNNTINDNKQINYFMVNPYGFESLTHISIDKLPTIFTNVNAITEEVSRIMYENPENKNYFKVNIAIPDITIFSQDLKLKSIQEDRFIKDFFINIIFKYFINIINEYKNKLSIEDFSSYMKQAIVYEKIARNIDMDDEEDKVHLEVIKNYINDFSRNKEIQSKIKETISLITEDETAKHILLQKIDNYNIRQAINEYKVKDATITIEDKEINRNLHYYKKQLEFALLREQNPGKFI